ncbi:hypothetical protein [Streptomyces sp. t39]|uniref:hypothetical protein n=1 Tax=Streptomyces sp. t39 TaxID=1828156 RepID=UPI0011CD3FD2|nr:hypothetical protein [Streptomyces sp. t39]TXS47851.1 hypothetical protein EAO77_31705 [Streptomyces sp. t39]
MNETDPSTEAAKGRGPLWLDPDDLRWLSKHCGCTADASDEEKDRCGRVRFRASAALHKHGHSH